MSLNNFAPAPVRVVVPARPKIVVADEEKFPVPVTVVPVIVKSELAVNDIPDAIVTLSKFTVPVPEFDNVVVPPNVVVLLPAASDPVPISVMLPVTV
jgi:hypothetical protein